jgi:hypothetical protein
VAGEDESRLSGQASSVWLLTSAGQPDLPDLEADF